MTDAPSGERNPPDMVRPVTSTVGTVAAGLMLAALLLSGPGTDTTVRSVPLGALAQAAAVVALLGFVLHRRVDVPGRAVGALVVLAGFVVTVADMLTLFGALNVWQQPAGLPLATAAAVPVVGMGIAMVLVLSQRRVFAVTSGLAVATVLGAVGFVASIVGGTLLVSLAIPLAGTSAIGVTYPLLTVAAALATVGFVVLALQWIDRDRSWLDFSMPTLRDVGLTVVGLVALILVLNVLTNLITELGLPTVQSGIEQQAEAADNPEFLLVMIPLSWLAIAPSEELLYRGLVQKYLYDYLSAGWAVVASSVIFAAIHFAQYADPNPLRMFVSLSVVFVLSLVLGYSYARSENLVVPILIHGTFNAISFLAMYARVTGTVEMV